MRVTNIRPYSWVRLALVEAALVILIVGCAGAAGGPSWGWPFAKKVDPNAPPTPIARMKELRELAKNSAKLPDAEKEQRANELAKAVASESDVIVRAQMMRTLGSFPSLASNSALYTGLQDSDPDIRIACCEAWGRRGGPDAAKVLGEVIVNDTDFDVRMAATRELASVKDPSAVAALGVALEDSNPALQVRAVRSLESVTGKRFGNDIAAWKSFVHGGSPREESLVSRIKRMIY